MKKLLTRSKALTGYERDSLLRYLLRLVEGSPSHTVRRVAQSLFNLLSREVYLEPIDDMIND